MITKKSLILIHMMFRIGGTAMSSMESAMKTINVRSMPLCLDLKWESLR